jgi:hypothetical protein
LKSFKRSEPPSSCTCSTSRWHTRCGGRLKVYVVYI